MLEAKQLIALAGKTVYNTSFIYAVLAPFVYGTNYVAVVEEVLASNSSGLPPVGVIIAFIGGFMVKENIKPSIGHEVIKFGVFIAIIVPVIYVINFRG